MTAEDRTRLRDVIARATDLDGATVCTKGGFLTVAKGDTLVALFPEDNLQSRLNLWLFLACGDNLTDLLDDLEAATEQKAEAK